MKNKNLFKKNLLILLILVIIGLTHTIYPIKMVYEEVTEPGINLSMQSMRAHEIQITNWVTYTMNTDTPGYVETGVWNIRTEDKKVMPAPFVRWRTGPPVDTGRDLDFYIDANGLGFFKIQLPGTRVGYTKDGRFQLDSQNRLVMVAGDFPLIGEGGHIYIPENTTITVSASGVIYADGEPVDKFDMAIFSPNGRDNLIPINGSIFACNGEPELLEKEGRYTLRQWHVEQNNVLKSLVGDTAFAKYPYEASSKIARTISQKMNSAVQMASP